MNRYVYMGLKNWYRIPGWALTVAWRNKNPDNYTHEENYRFVRNMVMRISRSGNVTVRVSGTEYLPDGNGYVLYPNHQGFFDSMALLEACERPFRLVAMKEVMEIPFLNYLFRMFRTVLMDREDLRQSFQVITEVSEAVKRGGNYMIFPEGTLEKEENKLLPMKAGAFKAAVKAGAPIVPVMLKNSFLPFDRKGEARKKADPVTVEVAFLPPLYPADYQCMKTKEIAEAVSERIQKKLDGKEPGEEVW